MEAFAHKFTIAHSGEITNRIKKVRGCKNGTDLLYHRAKHGGDRGSRAGCRQKVWCFLSVCFFLSRFGMTKFVITETLWSNVLFSTEQTAVKPSGAEAADWAQCAAWSSVILKTIMVSLHTGRFVVVHLYSTFSVDPQNLPLGANLYKKLPFFAILEAVSLHF